MYKSKTSGSINGKSKNTLLLPHSLPVIAGNEILTVVPFQLATNGSPSLSINFNDIKTSHNKATQLDREKRGGLRTSSLAGKLPATLEIKGTLLGSPDRNSRSACLRNPIFVIINTDRVRVDSYFCLNINWLNHACLTCTHNPCGRCVLAGE